MNDEIDTNVDEKELADTSILSDDFLDEAEPLVEDELSAELIGDEEDEDYISGFDDHDDNY